MTTLVELRARLGDISVEMEETLNEYVSSNAARQRTLRTHLYYLKKDLEKTKKEIKLKLRKKTKP